MDIICINGKFPEDTLAFYALFGVTTPQENTLYTIRRVVTHSIGKTGILLEEIHNPTVPIKTGIVSGRIEPTFAVDRFRKIDGTEISKEELREFVTHTMGLTLNKHH